MKFRKKPVVIEAIQFDASIDLRKWHKKYGVIPWQDVPPTSSKQRYESVVAFIGTLEGRHSVRHLDWIITGIRGEKYPCKPDIFEATYEPVETGEKCCSSPGAKTGEYCKECGRTNSA